MIAILKTFSRVVLTPVHLKRTLLIAFVVGSWLNLFNHGDEFAHGVMNVPLAIKLALTHDAFHRVQLRPARASAALKTAR